MAEGRSETDLLKRIVSWADAALVDADQNTVVHALERIKQYAGDLLVQVEQGIHVNPPLVIYGNPMLQGGVPHEGGATLPVQLVKHFGYVHQIKYEHLTDRKLYQHPFDSEPAMWAVRYGTPSRGPIKAVLIEGDKPLWGDL